MKNKGKPIIIFARKNRLNTLLIKFLAKRIDIGLIIYEQPNYHHYIKIIKKRVKKCGLLNTLSQLILHFLNVSRSKTKKRINEIIKKDWTEKTIIPKNKIITVQSINDSKVYNILKKHKPKTVIVSNTSIINNNLLNLSNTHFVNIHPGMLPFYRGQFGAYWAIYNKDIENVGVSIALIDSGIDTGKIIKQSPCSIDLKRDTPQTFIYQQYAVGRYLLLDVLKTFNSKNLEFIPGDEKGKLYYPPTLGQHIKWIKKKNECNRR